MGFYARPSWQLVRQIVGDLFVLGWVVVWWLMSRLVGSTVSAIADPARQTARAAGRMRDDFTQAAARAAEVPLAGDELRHPFDSAATSMGDVMAAADAQVRLIDQVATLTAILVLVIPVSIVLAWWVPLRLRFRADLTAARRFIDSAADLDLFALRAMAHQPMHAIAAVSDDPVQAWRDGDREVIDRLADLELRRSGLPLPRLQE